MLNHLFEVFIGLWYPHSVFDGALADADKLGQRVFVNSVNPAVAEGAYDLHVHVGVGNLPFIEVFCTGAHTYHLFLDAVGVFHVLSGGEDMPEGRGFQKLPELIDFFDVLPGDGLDGYGFVVVGLDEPLGLQHLDGAPDRAAAHAKLFCKHDDFWTPSTFGNRC